MEDTTAAAPAVAAPSAPEPAPAPAVEATTASSSTESAPIAPLVDDYDWDSWAPDSEVPEPYRAGISKVRAHYEEKVKQAAQDADDLRAYMFGEVEDNPYIQKSSIEKDLQRLRELEEQSSTWTKEKQELTEKLSQVPDFEKYKEDLRQEFMSEVLQYGEAEGQRLVESFASDYLNSLSPAEAEAKVAAAIEMIDEGVDATVAIEAARLSAEALVDFQDLVRAGADPSKALVKVKEFDGKRSRRPSMAAQLTSSSQKVSVLGNRQGEGASAQQAPPGSARESFRRRLGI